MRQSTKSPASPYIAEPHVWRKPSIAYQTQNPTAHLYQDIKQSTRGHSLMGAPRMRSSPKLTISNSPLASSREMISRMGLLFAFLSMAQMPTRTCDVITQQCGVRCVSRVMTWYDMACRYVVPVMTDGM
jgi:hypothetical protein